MARSPRAIFVWIQGDAWAAVAKTNLGSKMGLNFVQTLTEAE
jgi:hypothetical protein